MRARRKKQGDQEARHENISCAHVRDTESARDESAAFLTPRCARIGRRRATPPKAAHATIEGQGERSRPLL